MINRRKFIKATALSTVGMMMSEEISGLSSAKEKQDVNDAEVVKPYEVMKDVLKYKKIDAHNHVHLFDGGPEGNIEFAEKFGINKMIISRPITSGEGKPDDFTKYNDLVLKVMKQYPDRFTGQLTLNVNYQRESMEEIKRCIGEGMIGLKVYHQVKINNPLFYPIIEQFIDLKMIIHMHAHCQLGFGGYRMKYDTKSKPNTSIPEDFVDIAQRYPEAMFQYAHIGGGGDWEYACKAFKNHPNIYVDTSGSNNPENMIDVATRILGEDRLFYGSDNCYYQSMGKILASDLTEKQRIKVFYENYNNILKKSGRNF